MTLVLFDTDGPDAQLDLGVQLLECFRGRSLNTNWCALTGRTYGMKGDASAPSFHSISSKNSLPMPSAPLVNEGVAIMTSSNVPRDANNS
ncbi:hypothetical protein HETIRDRAFT_144002 [Heterobasidion irregulare TC 32-1]|uniref:Uncharacterized protein n=1 Tax=Heterobasidion irregulare (strain TC 32-1) TaxID=747525 RepID=W4JRK6_HETIT|nr:uncharacterized protein HETIRDRAFT_144002 [Heterobasidion irregulare TC 32-1]ETW76207.1 hypothetical protein HETIRDRAFT_144002 [Heterobasidion irregulare TC 32-1]